MLNEVFRFASGSLFMPTVVAFGMMFLLLAIYFRRPV
jgi:hypothetical protein